MVAFGIVGVHLSNTWQNSIFGVLSVLFVVLACRGTLKPAMEKNRWFKRTYGPLFTAIIVMTAMVFFYISTLTETIGVLVLLIIEAGVLYAAHVFADVEPHDVSMLMKNRPM